MNTPTRQTIDTEISPTTAMIPRPSGNGLAAPNYRTIANRAAAAAGGAQQKMPGRGPRRGATRFHKYRYTSAEAVIEEAKAALADSGLSLLPLAQMIADRGSGRLELETHMMLCHSERRVCAGNCVLANLPGGRASPLDKAAAIADTLSLSYYLRRLLLMPRVDPSDDLAGTQSPQEAPAPPKAAQPSPPPAPSPGEELRAKIRQTDERLAKKGWVKEGDFVAHMLAWAAERKLDSDAATWPLAFHGPASDEAKRYWGAAEPKAAPTAPVAVTPAPAQRKAAPAQQPLLSPERLAIQLQQKKLGWSDAQLGEWLGKAGWQHSDGTAVKSLDEISSGQHAEIVKDLADVIGEKQPEVDIDWTICTRGLRPRSIATVLGEGGSERTKKAAPRHRSTTPRVVIGSRGLTPRRVAGEQDTSQRADHDEVFSWPQFAKRRRRLSQVWTSARSWPTKPTPTTRPVPSRRESQPLALA